jgi:hypothetical protein
MRAAFLPDYRGTATGWQNATFPGTTAFVVELRAAPLTRAAARRHARAVLAAAQRATTSVRSRVTSSGRAYDGSLWSRDPSAPVSSISTVVAGSMLQSATRTAAAIRHSVEPA